MFRSYWTLTDRWIFLRKSEVHEMNLVHINPIRPSLFSRSPGPRGGGMGGSEARMPKIKLNINWLKWNSAWVIMSIRVFLMQNLRLITLLVLEIWRHKISLWRRERERVIKFGNLPPENGFNLNKKSFYVQNCSSRPKIDPSCQFQQFSSTGKFFHFQNFWDVSMRKEWQHPPLPIGQFC